MINASVVFLDLLGDKNPKPDQYQRTEQWISDDVVIQMEHTHQVEESEAYGQPRLG